MNVQAALNKLRTKIESLGYTWDSRSDDATPAQNRSFRFFWEKLEPATDTAGQIGDGNYTVTVSIILSLPQSGGNAAQTTIDLAGECEAVTNKLMELHAENSNRPSVILQFEDAVPFASRGNYIRAAITVAVSYLASTAP